MDAPDTIRVKHIVRYFIWDYDEDDGEFELMEVDEAQFLDYDGKISYERHTVRENGVSQIVLTADRY
jgi:hypothetical protein